MVDFRLEREGFPRTSEAVFEMSVIFLASSLQNGKVWNHLRDCMNIIEVGKRGEPCVSLLFYFFI